MRTRLEEGSKSPKIVWTIKCGWSLRERSKYWVVTLDIQPEIKVSYVLIDRLNHLNFHS